MTTEVEAEKSDQDKAYEKIMRATAWFHKRPFRAEMHEAASVLLAELRQAFVRTDIYGVVTQTEGRRLVIHLKDEEDGPMVLYNTSDWSIDDGRNTNAPAKLDDMCFDPIAKRWVVYADDGDPEKTQDGLMYIVGKVMVKLREQATKRHGD